MDTYKAHGAYSVPITQLPSFKRIGPKISQYMTIGYSQLGSVQSQWG